MRGMKKKLMKKTMKKTAGEKHKRFLKIKNN